MLDYAEFEVNDKLQPELNEAGKEETQLAFHSEYMNFKFKESLLLMYWQWAQGAPLDSSIAGLQEDTGFFADL